MNRANQSLLEAKSYLSSAEILLKDIESTDDAVYNPIIVNCIMSMVKCVDALMLEKRGETNKDHSTTSRALKGLYEDGLISQSFKSNVDSVRKWVVNEKTQIQYRNKTVSKTDSNKAIKASRRLLRKTEKELS